MKISTEILVHKNGSGYITEMVCFDKTIMDLASSLSGCRRAIGERVDKVNAIIRAQRIGDGVRLVSTETISGENDAWGFKTVYAFDDIRNVRIDMHPDSLPFEIPFFSGRSLTGTITPIRFSFDKGRKPLLTIILPRCTSSTERIVSVQTPRSVCWSPARLTTSVNRISTYLSECKICVRVRVEGRISQTNAMNLNAQRDEIILCQTDFSSSAHQTDVTEKVMNIARSRDLAQIYSAFRALPGVMTQNTDSLIVRY